MDNEIKNEIYIIEIKITTSLLPKLTILFDDINSTLTVISGFFFIKKNLLSNYFLK